MTRSVDVKAVKGWLADGGYDLSAFRLAAP
jgi:hypothetical protein